MGTPAGRLMDTLTTLVRQGAGMGTAAVAPFGAGMAGIGSVGGQAAAFMGGNMPLGPSGTAGSPYTVADISHANPALVVMILALPRTVAASV